jgi:hypothetical protein
LNKAVAQIRAQTHDPDEIRHRAYNWPYEVPLTPNGLAKHWPALERLRTEPHRSKTTKAGMALADRLEKQGR